MRPQYSVHSRGERAHRIRGGWKRAVELVRPEDPGRVVVYLMKDLEQLVQRIVVYYCSALYKSVRVRRRM